MSKSVTDTTGVKGLRVERDARVLRVSFDDSAKRNAIDSGIFAALLSTLAAASTDAEIDLICISGSGDDFSVGFSDAFLAELVEAGGDAWDAAQRALIPALWHNNKVVIASVRGAAWGAGCSLAALADITLAADTATFGHPETQHGFVGPTVWPWLVGIKAAKEYLATGRLMSASEAQRKGLINHMAAPAELEAATDQMLSDLLAMPRGTPGAMKKRVSWAYRDVSRVLYDDQFYQPNFEWMQEIRRAGNQFFEKVKDEGFHSAVGERDAKFTR